MTDIQTSPDSAELTRLRLRVQELEQERRHLQVVVDILQEISGTLHFVDILQTIARKLGETFGLDRCSIFLSEQGNATARLVASYEDPSIRNHVVDLTRYPELERAFTSGETVYIPDAQTDSTLKSIRGVLENRKVQSITVVPITWRDTSIGAIFLRTFRDGPAFSDADVKFTQVVAELAAKMLRNAYRFEQMAERESDASERNSRADSERTALIGFLRRLLDAYANREGAWSEGLLSRASGEELDRLVDVAMTVIQEEAKGR
ncbi:MAG: GAF domain-containing protein [Gemmatimonadales bacterium]